MTRRASTALAAIAVGAAVTLSALGAALAAPWQASADADGTARIELVTAYGLPASHYASRVTRLDGAPPSAPRLGPGSTVTVHGPPGQPVHVLIDWTQPDCTRFDTPTSAVTVTPGLDPAAAPTVLVAPTVVRELREPAMDVYERELITAVNETRRAQRLAPLAPVDRLAAAADAQAVNLLTGRGEGSFGFACEGAQARYAELGGTVFPDTEVADAALDGNHCVFLGPRDAAARLLATPAGAARLLDPDASQAGVAQIGAIWVAVTGHDAENTSHDLPVLPHRSADCEDSGPSAGGDGVPRARIRNLRAVRDHGRLEVRGRVRPRLTGLPVTITVAGESKRVRTRRAGKLNSVMQRPVRKGTLVRVRVHAVPGDLRRVTRTVRAR